MTFIKLPSFMKLPTEADDAATLEDLKLVEKKEKPRRAIWGWVAVFFMTSHSIFALVTFGGLRVQYPWDLLGVVNFMVMLYVIWVYCTHRDVHEDATERIGDFEKV